MRIGNTLPAFTTEQEQQERALASKMLAVLTLVTVCVVGLLATAASM